jgi:hypothetical protein
MSIQPISTAHRRDHFEISVDLAEVVSRFRAEEFARHASRPEGNCEQHGLRRQP